MSDFQSKNFSYAIFILKKWPLYVNFNISTSKTLLSFLGTVGKTFSLTLNLMILQTVRNECLRFGGHVGIQVSYNILQLEVLKSSPFFVTSPCFQ
jgi:hypothetical protein